MAGGGTVVFCTARVCHPVMGDQNVKVSLRKGNVRIPITYVDGGFSNILHASDFSVEADEKRVVFSMDFSTNQRTRSKESHSRYDVLELMRKHDKVKFLQIRSQFVKRTHFQPTLPIPLSPFRGF